MSLSWQCRQLGVSRRALYRTERQVPDRDLALMRDMDRVHLAHPFYGSRQMVAVMDWATRFVLSWRLSDSMDVGFFNTNQGAQFTSAAFTGAVEGCGARVPMEGRGRLMNTLSIQRPTNSDTPSKRHATRLRRAAPTLNTLKLHLENPCQRTRIT